jgi:hypothetical protein
MFPGPRARTRVASEGLADLEQAEILASQRRSLLAAAPREPAGRVHRELAAVERARELDARALALARENPWTPEVDAL